MGFNEKMGEGIDASGAFTFKQINEITATVVAAMGKKAVFIIETDESACVLTLGFFKTGAQKFWAGGLEDLVNKSPELLASVSVPNEGILQIGIADAVTSQQKLYGLIPVAPKAVHGITTYRDFLDHFTAELIQIDPEVTVTRK
jgi:hypothetical protein